MALSEFQKKIIENMIGEGVTGDEIRDYLAKENSGREESGSISEKDIQLAEKSDGNLSLEQLQEMIKKNSETLAAIQQHNLQSARAEKAETMDDIILKEFVNPLLKGEKNDG